MQREQFKPSTVANRVMPVCLSVILAISATTGVSLANPPAPHKATPATKTAPPVKKDTKKDTKKETVKSGSVSGEKSSDKSKEAKEKDAKDKEVKDKATLKKEFDASLATATSVDSMSLVRDPAQYMSKKVTFTATFNRFADIALDYKKAFRDSRDYVTFFVLRPDVTDHSIPLSEMKLFFPRKKSSEVMDLDSGDKIQVIGTEFSTALDEPWIDVEHIRVLEKTEKKEKKHTPEF